MASIALTGQTILQGTPNGPGHAEAAARLQRYARYLHNRCTCFRQDRSASLTVALVAAGLVCFIS